MAYSKEVKRMAMKYIRRPLKIDSAIYECSLQDFSYQTSPSPSYIKAQYLDNPRPHLSNNCY
jgi:hypothetical protein